MTRSENIMSFPSSKQSAWKSRFQRIIDHGKGNYLCLPFTEVRNMDALFDLYEATGKVFQKYPAVAEDFFDSADSACKLAERAIEKARLKSLLGDLAEVIPLKKEISR